MKAVVVTGARSSLGRRVVNLLAADTQVERVVAVDGAKADLPGPHPDPKVEHRSVDLLSGDLRHDDLDGLLENIDAIVHLSSVTDPKVRPAPAARSSAEGARRLLRAANGAGVEQIVAVTDAAVYGAWANNPVPLTEGAPLRPNPDFAYAVEMAQVEVVLGEWAEEHAAASVAVLRPTLTLARGEESWLARTLTAAAGIGVGDADPPVQFLDLDDLAQAVEVALGQCLDGVFNVAPDGWIPGETARALAGSTPRLRLPERLARRLAEWGWKLRLGPFPPGLLAYTSYPWVVANDRLKATGWAPLSSNEEALVIGHEGSRWSTMSPKRRQELSLVAATGGLLALGGGAVAVIRRLRRRSRS